MASGGRLRDSLAAFDAVRRNRNLRRLQLAWAGSKIGGWAYWVAIAVFAYEAGGAATVGLVGFIRLAASALAAPFLGVLADRYARKRVMIGSDLARVAALAAAAAVIVLDGPAAVVYALAVVIAVATSAFPPAQAALLPTLVEEPEELTAANVVSTTIESVGIFVGPALGGLIVAASNPGVALAVTAVGFLWSALLVTGVQERERTPPAGAAAPNGRDSSMLAGFRTILATADLRLLVMLFAAQTLVGGVLNVLVVVLAFEMLDAGEAGVGFLNSAIGLGGIAGAAAAAALVAGRRLAPGFSAGLVLWGLPLVLVAAWPELAPALLLLAVLGVGNTLVDVAGFTLLQRAVSEHVLARVLGVLESILIGSVAIGALVAPALVALIGPRGALATSGAVLPLLAVATWSRLRALDAAPPPPARALELLRGVPIFGSLPQATLEALARKLETVRLEDGGTLFAQGEPGDRFYVVESGEVRVSVDGRPGPALGPGEAFGEIALLRDVPRTATVTAPSGAVLQALERDDFVAAVTGHAPSAKAADAVIATRLSTLRPAVGTV